MSRGDVFDDPFDLRMGDSLPQMLDKCLKTKLSASTTYETLSNTILRLIREFSSENKHKKSSFESGKFGNRDPEIQSSIQKFCHFVETSLNELQVRLSRKAFDFTLCQILKWIKTSPERLLNDLFRALGAILYGAGTMSDPHKETLVVGDSAVLKGYIGGQSHLDFNIQRLAYQCFSNLAIRCDRGVIHEHTQSAILRVLLDCLTQPKEQNLDEVSHLRLIVIAFDGITSITQYNKGEITRNLGSIFASIRYYMVLGLPGFYDLPQRPLEPIKNTSIMNKLGANSAQQTAFNQDMLRMKIKNQKSAGNDTANDSDFESDDDNTQSEMVTSQFSDTEKDLVTPQEDYIDIRELLGSHKSEFSIISESNSQKFLCSQKQHDSDLSKLGGVCKKVRTVSLNCLLEVLKFSPNKLTFGYWWQFIPDESITDFVPSQHPFFYLMLRDRNMKSKVQALQCLSQFLVLARPYILAAADDRYDPKAYTSYSYTLAASVKELHRVLVQITSLDFGFVTLPVALQALSDLILSTPYHKLRFGLLTRVVRHLVNFLNSTHCPTRLEAIKCLSSITQIDPPLAEVYEIFKQFQPPSRAKLLNESDDSGCARGGGYIRSGAHTPLTSYGLYGTGLSGSSVAGSRSSLCLSVSGLNLRGGAKNDLEHIRGSGDNIANENQLPMEKNQPAAVVSLKGEECWAMSIMKDIIHNGHPYTKESTNPDQEALKISAYNFVASLSVHYFQVMLPSVDSIQTLVDAGLGPDVFCQEVKIAVLAMLEKVARAMPKCTQMCPDKLFDFWKHVLDGPLTQLLKPKNRSAIRSVACDCLAAIPPSVYERLPHSRKMYCVTLMIGYSVESDHNVAGAALRALGSYIQFLPSLKSDYTFIVDVSKAIFSLISHTNRYVRSRACWTLANLSDNFIALSDSDPNFLLELTPAIFCQCLQSCIKSSEDQDRCKYNAVRGIGSLLYCVNDALLDEQPRFNLLLQSAFDALIGLVAGPCLAKVRWNACYAAGLVLQNSVLTSRRKEEFIKPLQEALINTIESCQNFKVKINAVNSLQSMSSRSQFEDLFLRCVNVALEALVNSQTLSNFDEYKHQAELQDSLCIWLCKLVMFSSEDDFKNVFQAFVDLSLTAASKQLFQTSASKDQNSEIFFQVCEHIRKMDYSANCENTNFMLKLFTMKSSQFVSPYPSAEEPVVGAFDC